MDSNKKTILLVDDERQNLNIMVELLEKEFNLLVAKNGLQALERVSGKSVPDLILLDIMMPEMDGWEVCKRLKQNKNTWNIPIIMQTALNSPEDFQRGLELGAYYYLTKPIDPPFLLPLVHTALEEKERFMALQKKISAMDELMVKTQSWRINFSTLEDTYSITKFLAKACPDPNAVSMGLSELLINAVEHGITKITYDEKSVLNREVRWQHEVNRRLELPEFANRFAEVYFKRSAKEIQIRIEDPGDGFDWENYTEFSMERITDNHGRGIAMTNSCLDITFSGRGNIVTITVPTPRAGARGRAAGSNCTINR